VVTVPAVVGMAATVVGEEDRVEDCWVQPALATSATVANVSAAKVRRIMSATLAQGCALGSMACRAGFWGLTAQPDRPPDLLSHPSWGQWRNGALSSYDNAIAVCVTQPHRLRTKATRLC